MAQLGVAALDKGATIACEPRLDLNHSCSPECQVTYVRVGNIISSTEFVDMGHAPTFSDNLVEVAAV